MSDPAIERAAIALAAHRTRLWLGGNDAPAWRRVHEDVRESYRAEVRLLLDAHGQQNEDRE